MLEDLSHYIAYCQAPAPAFVGDTNAIAFSLPPGGGSLLEDQYEYKGLLFLKPGQGHLPWFLTGVGFAVAGYGPKPAGSDPIVRISVGIGHSSAIETVLEYCQTVDPSKVVSSETCDAFVDSPDETEQLGFRPVYLVFDNGTSRRQAILFGSNVLHAFYLHDLP